MKLFPIKDKLKFESDFQFVVFSILYLSCGASNVDLEDSTSHGRMDLVVRTPKYVYIFEFKLGENAKEAIAQIEQKDYSGKWEADTRQIIQIGVSFSPKTRTLTDYIIK